MGNSASYSFNSLCIDTIWRKILTVENIDKFDQFPAIHQYFPYQDFPLVSYLNYSKTPSKNHNIQSTVHYYLIKQGLCPKTTEAVVSLRV